MIGAYSALIVSVIWLLCVQEIPGPRLWMHLYSSSQTYDPMTKYLVLEWFRIEELTSEFCNFLIWIQQQIITMHKIFSEQGYFSVRYPGKKKTRHVNLLISLLHFVEKYRKLWKGYIAEVEGRWIIEPSQFLVLLPISFVTWGKSITSFNLSLYL